MQGYDIKPKGRLSGPRVVKNQAVAPIENRAVDASI